MFQLKVFNRKSLSSSSDMCDSCELRILLFCKVFPSTMGHDDFTCYFIKISTISFSFRLARHRLQSKRRSVHSSPASPFHFSRVQFIEHLVQNSASSSMQSSTAWSSPRHSFPRGPVHHHKTSADFRYQCNSHMDGKAWWRKRPTLHWVFSSLPFCCIRRGWE